MAPGADKKLSFSPPGAIGLVDQSAIMLIRFDEVDSATRPQDETGACEDFDVVNTPVSTVMPPVVAASLGRGRLFNGATMGLAATDREPGATLLTRDMSIQVALSWDAAAQDAAGINGTIISRGLGGSAAEYVCYGLRFDVVDAASTTGLIRWYWQDVAGVEKLQDGAEVCMPLGQYTLITATRRWVSPTEVELRYYVGDQLIGTVASSDGSIGGGTTGTLQLGCRTVGGVNGAFLAGTLDEVMLVDRAMCLEEIEATWLRITLYQPRGVQLFRDSIDPDFPISDIPSSDVQLDVRMAGQALGFAAAQTENLRANFLPQRAYGTTLEQWEEAVRVPPTPLAAAQSIDQRRARVVARLRQKQGISPDGVRQSLSGLIDCDPADLEFLAFSQRWLDDLTTLSTLRWDFTPSPATGITSSGGKAHFAPGAGTYTMTGYETAWRAMAASVSRSSEFADDQGEHALVKLALTTPQAGVEVGVWFGNRITGDYVLLGLKDDAGTFKVVTEVFTAHVSGGLTVLATLGGNPAAIWLHLYQSGAGWLAAWSTTSRTTGYTTSAPIAGPTLMHWSGCYLRSYGAIGAAIADFDDFELWTPNGSRPFVVYVFRDPGLGGVPDVVAIRSVLREIRHAFTEALFCESKVFRCDLDPCDSTPMGAL